MDFQNFQAKIYQSQYLNYLKIVIMYCYSTSFSLYRIICLYINIIYIYRCLGGYCVSVERMYGRYFTPTVKAFTQRLRNTRTTLSISARWSTTSTKSEDVKPHTTDFSNSEVSLCLLSMCVVCCLTGSALYVNGNVLTYVCPDQTCE